MSDYSTIRVGTIVGTFLAILGTIAWVEIEKTIVLGGIGAVISFFVSLVLKKLTKKWGK